MSLDNSDLESTDFSGIVRLFPLPNLVLYPGVMQPLHIFEPRYRQMLRHALDGDSLIATSVYRPNWEECLACDPPIFDVITIGKIIAHTELEDGRSNVLLKGISRARIIREIPTELAYRMADVDLLHEPELDCSQLLDIRGQLLDCYARYQAALGDNKNSTSHMVEEDLPLGMLIDVIAFSVDLGVLEQQLILETVEITSRCRELISILKRKRIEDTCGPQDVCEFPPEFSYN